MLRVEKICKSFNGVSVLNEVSFTVDMHEIVCLMGKSGAGKTTILRCLNQLESLDDGEIILDDLKITAGSKNVELQKKIGLVFQSWNLFPHMTVLENCINAPVYHKLMSKDEAISKAEKMLDEMGILDKKNKYPATLSGGQKQRVAIVRACMLEPKILCFDEPTSALDPESTKQVARLIEKLASREIGILIVTHDESLAKELDARVVRLG
ncbi:MAG: amino acid ABC transporter ATP-binding protein [Erysipelotrichaceae bacterium]|nr:amino acid ABC transporter ATP-binding protein [Erysipelotrichaceae bacterium]MBR3694344.1 amino acid ABC transporter ATP-binding protein [Erysipelotrichales bacterium]